jgi:hypothetical protein
MRQLGVETSFVVPWEIRLGLSFPTPSLLTGALVALFGIALVVSYHFLIGAPILNDEETAALVSDFVRTASFMAIMIGYSVGAAGYVALGTVQELRALEVREPEGGLELQPDVMIRSRFIGGAGSLAAILIFAVIQSNLGGIEKLLMPEAAPLIAFTTLFGWVLGRIIYYSFQPSVFETYNPEELDLMELGAFRSLGRISLRTALLYTIGISLLIPWTWLPGYRSLVLPLILSAIILPTLALVLPVRGARAVLLKGKREALEKLGAEIRLLRGDAMRGQEHAQNRMVFLLSYRASLEAIPEWPFDVNAVRRFGLYLLIPVGSWVASALVERVVDAALK